MAKKNAEPQAPSFEDTLATLESLVDTLEQGDISLEDSMVAFEKGIALTRQAQQTLAQAEQKVQLLMEQDGQPVAKPFEDPESDD